MPRLRPRDLPGELRRGPIVVVADGNTFEVAGKEVQRELEDAGYTMMEPYVFPGRPATLRRVLQHREAKGFLREHDAIPVAVGVGDAERHRQALVARVREALHVRGHRGLDGQVHRVRGFHREGWVEADALLPPKAVVADLEILKNAPRT